MACFIDMDGVLFDFMGGALARHGRLDVLENYPTGVWAVEEHLGITASEFWEKLEGHDFWADLKPYPWMNDLIALVDRLYPSNWWISTSPCHDPYSSSGKVESLQRHMPKSDGKTFHRFFLGKDKYHLAGDNDVLIDDNEQNCRKFSEAGGYAILFPAPWNGYGKFSDDPAGHVRDRLIGWIA